MAAMSESRSNSQPADVDAVRQLDEIASELYALRPDAFAAARDDQVRQARAAGQAGLARELASLRRPTQSAWLINLVWRDQQEVMEQLFQLAADLSRAQAQASGPDMHRLTAQRRELEAALIRRAGALAAQAGVSVSAAMEREAQETLSAALARTDVADEVRSGRLVKPANYAGFGMEVGTSLPAAPPATARRQESRDAEHASSEPKPDELALRAAKRARERRAEAERQVQDARAALEAAAQSLATHDRAVDAAHLHHHQVRQELDQLQERLRNLKVEAVSAEQAAVSAAHRRDQAQKQQEVAARALDRAEQHLKELTETG
jgi:hypothetical protein